MKLDAWYAKCLAIDVSPVLVGGSGLKLRSDKPVAREFRFLPSWWAGVD